MFKKLVDPAMGTDAHPYHAHEGYCPTSVPPVKDMSYGHWTERVSVQSEFVAARELTGLPDSLLESLSREYVKSPHRKRSDWFRFSYGVSGLFAFLALMFLLAHKSYPGMGDGLGLFELLALGALAVAIVAGLGGSASSLYLVPLMSAHTRLGSYVSELDERHPWLYRTRLLMSNQAANEYRKKTLLERGRLRGIDYLMMREVAAAHEAVLLTEVASRVTGLVQGVPAEGTAGTVPFPAPSSAAAGEPAAGQN